MPADAGQRRRHLVGVGGAGAGDAGDRDVVEEAARARQHPRQPRLVGGRRGEEDQVEADGRRRQVQLVRLLRRQIDDDQPVDAGLLGIGDERRDAVGIDRIVVAHQHDRRLAVGLAEGGDHAQRAAQRLAGAQRALRRRLDRRTVGHRIGERHAELDQVGARRRQPAQDVHRGAEIGIAGGDEGDQPAAPLLAQRGEAPRDALLAERAHSVIPK